MNWLKNIVLGDKFLTAFVALLSIISLLPGFSASSSIEYTAQTGTIFGQLGKQASFLIIGLIIMFGVQKINYMKFKEYSTYTLFVVFVLLLITALKGHTIGGANASRWLSVPGIPISIQPSTIASVVLMIYIASYLSNIRNKKIKFLGAFIRLFLPIACIIGLIFPSNGSTALILFSMVIMLLFLGGFPLSYLISICGTLIIGASIFIFIALNTNLMPNSRVETWKNRIERFRNPSQDNLANWQETNAKAAIVEGGITGKGPGKSAIKHTLPQASSDFIFAVIVEEYGTLGGLFLIFLFLSILFRIVIIGTKIDTFFGSLLSFAVGIPLIFQAIINMGVAVGLFPTTGQPLPMVSFGGTSLWITCVSFGILLSISKEIKKNINSESDVKQAV